MAGKKLEDVNPNRMELLLIRKRIMLAEKGHKLLSEKRDAMVMQFLKMIDEYETSRKSVLENLQDAYDKLLDVELLMGQLSLEDLSSRIPQIESLKLSTKSLIGVTIPDLKEIKLPPMDNFQYSVLDTPAKLDDTVLSYRSVLPDIVKLSITEAGLEKMAKEIEKTKRRVNALEYVLIPRLKSTKRYIEMQLQEHERQDFFRRKRIKALMIKET